MYMYLKIVICIKFYNESFFSSNFDTFLIYRIQKFLFLLSVKELNKIQDAKNLIQAEFRTWLTHSCRHEQQRLQKAQFKMDFVSDNAIELNFKLFNINICMTSIYTDK